MYCMRYLHENAIARAVQIEQRGPAMLTSIPRQQVLRIILLLIFPLLVPALAPAQPANDSLRGGSNGRGLPSQGEISRSGRLLEPRLAVSQPHARRVQGVNSTDRDNNPIVSADGAIMFFNSTRCADRPWATYNPFKKRYDDDIYFA